jgi:hypothetical protein
MPNFRLLPPVNVGVQNMTVNGRAYSGAPGSVADVIDADAGVLAAAGWTKVAFSGPTSARPTIGAAAGPYFVAAPGLHFVDTTLNLEIVFDGATWRNPINGNAV